MGWVRSGCVCFAVIGFRLGVFAAALFVPLAPHQEARIAGWWLGAQVSPLPKSTFHITNMPSRMGCPFPFLR